LNMTEKLKNIFCTSKQKGSYKINLEIENAKDSSKPYLLDIRIRSLDEFRKQKFWGDESGQSWLVESLNEVNRFYPDYKQSAGTTNKSCFYEYRAYQQSKKEVLRGWFAADRDIGELHTVNKGHCKNNPIPGKAVVKLSTQIFSLFRTQKPGKIMFGDSSYRRPDKVKENRGRILLRLCDVLAYGKTWYQQQYENAQPIKDPKKYYEAVAALRAFTLEQFHSILDKKQGDVLIRIYNNTLGKQRGNKVNSFDGINETLSSLQKAVLEAKDPLSYDDYDLNELICDGISLYDVDKKKLKEFTGNNLLATFKDYIYTIIWECGYTWEVSQEPCNRSDDKPVLMMI
jgi:hypothetical protein